MTRARVPRGARVLCAVSGGPDSTALWLAAMQHAREYDLLAVHVHHGLRDGADDDAAFVRALTQRAIVLHARTRIADARCRDGGIENAARDARYALLVRAARRLRAHVVCIAHTADDQAETVLMRLVRGAGPRGLGGMRAISARGGVTFVRPFLALPRSLVHRAVHEAGVTPRLDETNTDERRERAWLRARVLAPMRERHGDGAAMRIARAARLTHTTDRALARIASGALRTTERGEIALAAEVLASYDSAVQRCAVRSAIERSAGTLRGVSLQHVELVRALLHSPAAVQLPHGVRAVRRGDHLVFERHTGAPMRGDRDVAITVPGITELPNGCTLAVVVRDAHGWRAATDEWSASFDAAALTLPLVARAPRPGDRVRLLGLGGSRKVSDLLSEARVPRHARARQVVIDSADGIVWVPGIRRGESAPVLSSSRDIVEATVQWATHPWT